MYLLSKAGMFHFTTLFRKVQILFSMTSFGLWNSSSLGMVVRLQANCEAIIHWQL